MGKRKIKKGIIKKIVIFLVIVIVIVSGYSAFKYYTGDYYKLTKLGYTKEDAKEIISIKKADLVLTLDYNDKMVDILEAKYYMDKNLEKYITYYNNNQDKSIDDIIAIVNVHADNAFYGLDLSADTSRGTSMLVNKFYKLDSSYTPTDLVTVSNWYAYGEQQVEQEVLDQYKLMFNAAKKAGYTIIINDSYRSYSDQDTTWKKYGDDYAARAGYSEHNTGLAVDVICNGATGNNFNTTPEYAWLQEHAHEYGFILRYPENKEYLTGYEYESWHYRYLGVDLATKVYESGLTYDEYYAYYLEDSN